MNQPFNSCRTLLFCLVLSLTINTLYAQHKKARVLFIGNSYTYGNDLPKLVSEVAASTGDTLEYEMSAEGGLGYANHLDPRFTTVHTLKKLRTGKWDYVVLQEQSLLPALEPQLYYGYSFYYALKLVDSVRRYNPCAEIIFYMTWGRKNGLPSYCNYAPWPYNCTYSSMDSVIRARYLEVAYYTKSTVAPVGAVWRYIRSKYSTIELFDPDESHPSSAGSYAGACSFYTAIFKKPAEAISYNFSLPADVAANIRIAASKVVYDSLKAWRIGKTETIAGFSHDAHDSRQHIRFTNQSVNALQYKWDFGDGQQSTVIHPTHTYLVPGVYTTRLIATGNSCSDTIYARVNATNGPDGALFTFSPNPATDQLYITSELLRQGKYQVQVFNNAGQLVYQQQASNAPTQVINLSKLASGIYIVNICDSRNIYRKKILVQ